MSSLQLPSFSPAPRKEGRYHPCSRNRRRQTAIRVIVGAIAIAVCYAVFVSILVPAQSNVAIKRIDADFESPPNRTVFEDQSPLEYESHPPTSAQVLLDEPAPSTTSEAEHHALEPTNSPEPEITESKPKSKVKVTKVESSVYDHVTEEEHTRFEQALTNVLMLLPDEMHVRELLRPVEGTGKEKLREMGLRARAFKKFFEAWEALHLVPMGESFYVRDDIVQYLRSRAKQADDSNLAQTVRSYETFRSLLQNLATLLFPWTSPYFSDHMTLHTHFHRGGRGIVLTAGDDQAPFLLTSINLFRKLGCNLPIEVMYLGDSDLGEDFRSELEALPDVITRDLSQMVNDRGWELKGWAGKPFAILLSSFREVIFVDADALFFKNPEVLFDDPSYIGTGALFFHDRLMMAESKKRWLQQTLPKPISKQARQSRFWTGQSGHMQESGVVVVDKWRHFVAMLLVTRMNGPDRDGDKEHGKIGVYDMVYGDKETFWIAWELVGDLDYAFHKGGTGIMGKVNQDDKDDTETKDGDKEKGNQDAKSKERKQDEPARNATDDQEPPQATLATREDEESPELDPEPEAKSVTICAPQVLHLGRDGNPLWFNGWILNNKFDKKHTKAGEFDLYAEEPREITEPEAWKLGEHNMCCLTTYHTQVFSEEEKETLKMIVVIAKEVGAYDQD